ncbi:MAG TPA: hypothetical protein PK876_05280 [Elusimicrobiota bacterium]|nr:hypothetical protein [Elusimicrobiota bacterium]
MRKIIFLTTIASCLALNIWLTGCGKNGNIFGGMHEKGSSTDSASLMSDARTALINKEFANAKAYYEQLVAKEPRNSEALYGAAVSNMGSAGLDLGTLVSNIVASNNAAPAARALADELRSASLGVPGAVTTDARSLLNGLDTVRLDAALDRVICFLTKIRIGATDGRIKMNDVDMLINLGVCHLLRAIIRPQTAGLVDIRTTADGQGYDVVITKSGSLDSYRGTIDMAATDLLAAFQCIKEATRELNATTGDTIADMQTDFNKAFNDFQTQVNGQLTNDLAYNANTYNAFTSDPGDCLTK